MPDCVLSVKRVTKCAAAAAAGLLLASCGSTMSSSTDASHTISTTTAPTSTATTSTQQSAPTTGVSATTATTTLPGTGKPTVQIGDKNFTEQFVLGELYYQALTAEGFSVTLTRNIGPTEVALQAVANGSLGMYPEYLNVWNNTVVGSTEKYRTSGAAYDAAQGYALSHGFVLLDPTPFSNTPGIAMSASYAASNNVETIGDLANVSGGVTVGAPPQFQQNAGGLPALVEAYGFAPTGFTRLAVGDQYAALSQGTVQAADVNTTDGQLLSDEYVLLKDPKRVFGWGNVVPVVSPHVLDVEGPAFESTINRVSALLTLPAIRQMNAAVDLWHEDPVLVAKEFLFAHGLLPLSAAG
jgi:osmoprotectant transport system substrate-binding protein